MNPEPTDLNDLAAIARVTKSVRHRRALASAASEIERLRKERDEARREILESLHPDLRKSYANARGWDCLKEATDDR